MPRSFWVWPLVALVPELLSRPTPVVDFFAAERVFQRLTIHPGHHQHGPVKPVLSDRGNQAGFVEAELIDEGRVGTASSRRARSGDCFNLRAARC